MKRLCQIYRSPRRQEMYLYVDKARGLDDVPEMLLQKFGEPQPVMTLLLGPERRLARADTAQVLAQIEMQGFYLQMPPTPEELLRGDGNRG
ncbi:MAG: YcgL domain-containing protein [Halioglobus sp.]